MQDYWEGDRIQLRSSGENGTYGQVKDRFSATVHIDGALRIVQRSDIVPLDDIVDHTPDAETLLPPVEDSCTKERVSASIDLHMEALDPKGTTHPNRILTMQLDAAKRYLAKAIKARKTQVLLIHGKGSGLLRAELRHYLEEVTEARHTFDRNDGGATEVWFIYH